MALQVTFPRVAAVGSSIKLSLRLGNVSTLYKKDNDFALPPVTLQRVEVCLMDTITLRCSRPVLRFDEHINEFPGGHVGEMSCQVNHVFNPTEDGKRYQDMECKVMFEIPASCSPTFMTWNVSTQWQLRVTAFFKCLGKVSTKPYYSSIRLISEPKLSGSGIGEARELPGDVKELSGKVEVFYGGRALTELHGDRAVADHGDTAVAELHGDTAVAELPGNGNVSELPG